MPYNNGALKPADQKYLDKMKSDIQGTVRRNSYGGSIVTGFIGACALLASLSLGPIDLMRSAYNQVIGDTPVIKARLVDYSRKGMRMENPKWDDATVEKYLAEELNVRVDADGKINPLEASISDLWDVSEDYSHSLWQQFVWTDLD